MISRNCRTENSTITRSNTALIGTGVQVGHDEARLRALLGEGDMADSRGHVDEISGQWRQAVHRVAQLV